jgi:hypothetical protein
MCLCEGITEIVREASLQGEGVMRGAFVRTYALVVERSVCTGEIRQLNELRIRRFYKQPYLHVQIL